MFHISGKKEEKFHQCMRKCVRQRKKRRNNAMDDDTGDKRACIN